MDVAHRRVARRIRELARERGIRISHVADRAGVARGHFFHVLAGTSSPTLAWLVLVADALGVDVEELVVRRRAS